jgi:hypothetical protein
MSSTSRRVTTTRRSRSGAPAPLAACPCSNSPSLAQGGACGAAAGTVSDAGRSAAPGRAASGLSPTPRARQEGRARQRHREQRCATHAAQRTRPCPRRTGRSSGYRTTQTSRRARREGWSRPRPAAVGIRRQSLAASLFIEQQLVLGDRLGRLAI